MAGLFEGGNEPPGSLKASSDARQAKSTSAVDKRILAVVCNGTKAASTQFNIPIAYACNLRRILKESSLKANGGDDGILKNSRQLVFFPPLYKGFRNGASRSEEETVGPRFLPPRLNGEIYRAFLERELHGLLHDIPLATRVNLLFMHDGAPAHYCRNVRAYLNAAYPGQWIGRAGPTPCPARSPDMNPLDFYLWGHLKSLVYASAAPNVEVLQQRIEHACGIVRNELNGLCNVQRSLRRRAQKWDRYKELPAQMLIENLCWSEDALEFVSV
ncbi:hypothetical protein ANN_25281 [Periplaneta americana]|uniref:Uncharacterized protein n=1 Tax=Periplaneta americana TaxID=6978 RepID=A0ABQ8S0W6_PERAM|nr:hypothetical protein ANN_25281 [Periplaneta americana]